MLWTRVIFSLLLLLLLLSFGLYFIHLSFDDAISFVVVFLPLLLPFLYFNIFICTLKFLIYFYGTWEKACGKQLMRGCTPLGYIKRSGSGKTKHCWGCFVVCKLDLNYIYLSYLHAYYQRIYIFSSVVNVKITLLWKQSHTHTAHSGGYDSNPMMIIVLCANRMRYSFHTPHIEFHGMSCQELMCSSKILTRSPTTVATITHRRSDGWFFILVDHIENVCHVNDKNVSWWLMNV